jgi:prepilin-type N-terminal cleavage/methylation domain-containing protein
MSLARIQPVKVHSVRAFTLVEVMAVVMILGILAVSTLPALGRMDDAKVDAAADAIESEAVYARSLAMASGAAAGLAIDVEAQSVTTVLVDSVDGVVPARGATGVIRVPMELDVRFRGAEIEWFIAPDGASGTGIVWFAHNGVPQSRDRDGVYLSQATHDAEVMLNNGTTIVISRGGAVMLTRSGGEL